MNIIQTDPEIMGGKPCFAGTRVPIKNLFDYLSHDRSVEQFLLDFPTVSREQALSLLDMAREKVSSNVATAQVG